MISLRALDTNPHEQRELKALFKIFCKHGICDEIRDLKIQEPEAVLLFPLR